MANEGQRKSYSSYSSDAASLDLYESIKQLADAGLEKEFLTYDELLFKLRRWWCQYYRRPYKDPLLDSYTFEELLYEYFDINREVNRKPDEVKVSEELEAEDRDWAAEEEARELAELEAFEAAKAKEALSESDIIKGETDSLTDEQWAAKHDEPQKVLKNPSAEEVDEGGDISATFEAD